MYSAVAVRMGLASPLVCVFCLGMVQGIPAEVVDIEKELLFAEGLEARGLPELAAKHLESVLEKGPLAGKDEARLRHALAEICRKIASSPGPSEKKVQYLEKAGDNYERVLKLQPVLGYADEAKFSLGTVYKARARVKKRDWEKLRDELARLGDPRAAGGLAPEERAQEAGRGKRRREVQKLVGQARDEVGRLLQAAVDCLSRAAGDREKEIERLRERMREEGRAEALAGLDARLQNAQERLARARYECCTALISLGELLGPDSPEGRKHLQTAASQLGELAREFNRWIIGRQATVDGGHAHCLMKAYGLGFKRYAEVISEDDNDALDEVVQRAYYRFAESVLHADPEHYPENIPPRHPLVTYLLEGLDYAVTREDTRQGKSLKDLAERFGRDPHVVMRLSRKNVYLIRTGEKLCVYQGLFRRFQGIDAERLGKAATLLLAEAQVNWGKELKAQGRPLKEWKAKVRAGIRHVERIAEGDDVWAHKAGSLLAGWAEVMEEIGYVSPVQAYAGAVASFCRARKASRQTEKRRLYDNAIRKFQEVIEAGRAGQAAGVEQLLDERKLVDSWYMMGRCYRETGRTREAALCWNACARAFPSDTKAERVGYQSASTLGALYQGAPEKSRRAVGRSYEEMLGDFIGLFPEGELARKARYNYAQVPWDRGDYEEAARRFTQVSPESPYYDRALYRLGLCYLNQSTRLARDGHDNGDEVKAALLQADGALETLVRWVDDAQAPDEETVAKRKDLQARAVLERAKIRIRPSFSDPVGAIEQTASYSEKYAPVLTESARKELFPAVIFTRVQAHVMRSDLERALEELGGLLAYPESARLAPGLDHVAAAHYHAAQAKERASQRWKEQLEQREAEWGELRKEGKDGEAASMETVIRSLRDGIAAFEAEALRLELSAADLYHQLITRAPGQRPGTYLFAAQVHFVAHSYDKASVLDTGFLNRFGADPKHSGEALQARARLAQSLYHLGRHAEASPHFRAVDDAGRASDEPKAQNLRFAIKPLMNHCHKALALELLRDPARREEALAHFTEALNGWAMLQKLLQNGTDEWWEARFESLDILYARGDYGLCLRHLVATKLMYPGLGGDQWRAEFLDLAKRLKSKLTREADLRKIERVIEGLAR